MRLPSCLATTALLVGALTAASCTDSKTPLAPTAIAAPPVPLVPPPLPTTVPGVLAIAMPVLPGDSANLAFGIAPFGFHDANHAEDGHAGWDIEYRAGALVRAAAAGTVDSVVADPLTGRFTVVLAHVVSEHHYRTMYTNLASVQAGVVADAVVQPGQPLGAPGVLFASAGTDVPGSLGYRMAHFQLDDLEFHREGFSEPKAVSPEPFLTSTARSLFDGLWSQAAYAQELVEPFVTNPRVLSFPASRTWLRAGGNGPAGIRFTRSRSRVPEYEYALLAESGTVIETGAVAINTAARPYPMIALTSPTAVRLGLYDIVSNEMRLALGNAGTARPGDLSAAAIYRTTR